MSDDTPKDEQQNALATPQRRAVALLNQPLPEGATQKDVDERHKFIHLDLAIANILKNQLGFVITDDGNTADGFIAALKASIKPRDGVEEMLLAQMIVMHARVVKLSDQACKQE